MRDDDPSKWVEDADGYSVEETLAGRGEVGFGFADWINFDTYIAWVIANAVKKMKADGHTEFYYPDEPEENWGALTHAEYDVMIKGFEAWADTEWVFGTKEEREEVLRNLEDALEIFKNRFQLLWD